MKLSRNCRSGPTRGFRLPGYRQYDDEFAALILACAVIHDLAAMRFNQIARKRQSDAWIAPADREWAFVLPEQIEHSRQCGLRNADAVVGHADLRRDSFVL
jgi:hypothetical protein